LAEQLKTSPLLAQVLLNRGLRQAEECHSFLRPNLKALLDPNTLAGLPRAAERIAKAIRDHQKIVIYGDYDVDGVSGTAILWRAIRMLGGQVDYYIPHRLEEGYGLNAEAIEEICQAGAGLIVTVDCGITAIEPAKAACARGVDLIITDHHEPALVKGVATLPECLVVVHPRLAGAGEAYGNPGLCGAGVAFKLAWGVGLAVSSATRVNPEFREFLVDATALAALGTIADVVPLVGENRVLAAFGLGGLKQSKLVGIRALIESAGLTGQEVDSYHVGFLLAPRLNACGRMGHAGLAVELFTSADHAKAIEIATYLEQQNRARQAMEREILDQAMEQIEKLGLSSPEHHAIVLGAEGWHPGVIGIVAARIVDRFHRPAVMVALSNALGQGSARSVAGFHLARALEACREHLVGFGGHEMAAGLKLDTARFEAFREAFCLHARSAMAPELLVPELRIDCVADLRQMTAALVLDLQRLGPFGHGNRRPVLCCRDLEIASPPRRVGKTGDHVQLLVRQDQKTMKCIAFNYGGLFDRLQSGARIDLAVEPILNEFNGRSSVELEVKDIHFPETGARP
jgi:single-stranded-DNA-specific exonuclease